VTHPALPGPHREGQPSRKTYDRNDAVINELGIGAIVFACLFGGALGGRFIREALPEHHLTKETEDVVRLGMGVIATISAMTIGLLLAAAKGSFESKNVELRQFSADLILLDRQLAHYGPEAKEARDLLRRYTRAKIDSLWPDQTSRPAPDPNSWLLLEDVQDRLRELVPQGDAQRWLQARALQLSGDLARARWLMVEQMGPSIPEPLLVIVVFGLTIVFISFGLFSLRNATVTAALFVCGLSVAGFLFLILEMEHPFGGLIQISSGPMRDALARLGE
jgi:hypothetical protein